MSLAEPQHTSAHDACLALLTRIERVLETRKTRIDDEVKNYPRPIAGCDVQFEYALEQQAGIRKELQRASALRETRAEHGEFTQLVGEFVTASAFIDSETAREITASLANLSGAADIRTE